MISMSDFHSIRADLERLGFYHGDVDWSENVQAPTDPDAFAREIIFVICNSGMKNTVARGIYLRIMEAIDAGESAASVFGHKGKAGAIDRIWSERQKLFAEYQTVQDKLGWCADLPWIGSITKYHLAKNFGIDVAKPDVHLQRLADQHGTSVEALCADLARKTRLRVATVDVILWRACAEGVISSPTGCFRDGRPLEIEQASHNLPDASSPAGSPVDPDQRAGANTSSREAEHMKLETTPPLTNG